MIRTRIAYVYYLYNRQEDKFYVKGPDCTTKWTKDATNATVWNNKSGPSSAKARYLKRHKNIPQDDIMILEGLIDLQNVLDLYHVGYNVSIRRTNDS